MVEIPLDFPLATRKEVLTGLANGKTSSGYELFLEVT